MNMRFNNDRCRPASQARARIARGAVLRPARRQLGIALVITLIMLSVTLVMALAFLAIARRETTGVDQHKDNKTAELAARSGIDRALAQMTASMLASFNTNSGISSNAYNVHLFVSTNYEAPIGFNAQGLNPKYPISITNVSYFDPNGNLLTGNYLLAAISNQMILPRPPVFVQTNPLSTNLDFRFYLDLNQNGHFEANGMQPVISDNLSSPFYDTNGNPIASLQAANVLSNFMVGDPEWVGVLEHPDEPHGPQNKYLSRYAFIALPAGNALDINYIHNEALSPPTSAKNLQEGYLRNQGVGSWELNLAAFLADLNSNQWSAPSASQARTYYAYNEPIGVQNAGHAFDDARALVKFRYAANTLPTAGQWFTNPLPLKNNNIDNFSRGPVQTTLEYYRPLFTPQPSIANPWSGADNTNHYFSLFDWFDGSKTGTGIGIGANNNSFTNRLRAGGKRMLATTGGTLRPTYDSYSFYRLLDEMASDSSPEDGRLNLNYANAAVSVDRNNVLHANIVPGAETNFVRWNPTNFFLAAADQMLRTYSSYWYGEGSNAYISTFAFTNSSFGITNIPVWVSNRFVYTPAVHRLLQLAANIYDASTNDAYGLPHVYRPLFRCENNPNHDIYIMGYVAVNYVSGTNDVQLASPYDVTQLYLFRQTGNKPIVDPRNGNSPINVYGVPWIIGAKKYLPNFNQLSLLTAATVVRKLEISRNTLNPKTATYTTNQAYIVWVTNQLGVTFWNSYSNEITSAQYNGQPIQMVVSDSVQMSMTNEWHGFANWGVRTNFSTNMVLNTWPGSGWANGAPQPKSFVPFGWPMLYQSPLVYNSSTHNFSNGTFEVIAQLDQLGLVVTNYLQAYILIGHRVVDYVQLRAPVTLGGINQVLADPNYGANGSTYYQWSTNIFGAYVPYGVQNQLYVSGHPSKAPPAGGVWSQAATPVGDITPEGEAAFYNGFFTPNFKYLGKGYENKEYSIQAPYTPFRTVYSSYLLQANDPLVHYTASDLGASNGMSAVWANGSHENGVWSRSDDPGTEPLPTPPLSPLGGRYQPWGSSGQLAGVPGTDGNLFNLAYKDPLMVSPDRWDFPTNQYPTPGWLGRVHRGTPWQTVYLKSTNILGLVMPPQGAVAGHFTWAQWTGDTLTNNYYKYQYFDALNCAPQMDYLLFDIFTTRYNDNSVRGTLPVNVGMGRSDGGLAAWSALFSGMTALTNTALLPIPALPLTYSSIIMNPAGVDAVDSPLWKIVNGPSGINVTRTNMQQQVFNHVGQILATPALSVASPFLNTDVVSKNARGPGQGSPFNYGISDEMYEWLPQQMMGLVRNTEPRYVVYCFGQTLRPTANGTVLGGAYDHLVANYKVTAESVIRAVIRVENANTTHPHAVIESYNVLPPY